MSGSLAFHWCVSGVQVEEESVGHSAPWMQDCVVALSPCSDLLVVARDHRAVFLTGQERKTRTHTYINTDTHKCD